MKKGIMASMRSVLHGKSSSGSDEKSETNRGGVEKNVGVMRKLPRQAEGEDQWSVGGIFTGFPPISPPTSPRSDLRSHDLHLLARTLYLPCRGYIFPVADACYPLTFLQTIMGTSQ